ncbi:uncharacterized protein TNCV_4771831 [Trichonephila clavipes]|nr:uncharacterized protein TNCV_4771831 [Trichonephila clavipes]
MGTSYFRGCPRLHPFHCRQGRIFLARKSQSRHHLAFEIHSLLHRMPSRFLHVSTTGRCLPNHTTEIPKISLTLDFPVTFGLTRNN